MNISRYKQVVTELTEPALKEVYPICNQNFPLEIINYSGSEFWFQIWNLTSKIFSNKSTIYTLRNVLWIKNWDLLLEDYLCLIQKWWNSRGEGRLEPYWLLLCWTGSWWSDCQTLSCRGVPLGTHTLATPDHCTKSVEEINQVNCSISSSTHAEVLLLI